MPEFTTFSVLFFVRKHNKDIEKVAFSDQFLITSWNYCKNSLTGNQVLVFPPDLEIGDGSLDRAFKQIPFLPL